MGVLRRHRRESGTGSSLAKALGVWPLTISRWELGVRNIPPFLHLALESLEKKGGEKMIVKRKINWQIKQNILNRFIHKILTYR